MESTLAGRVGRDRLWAVYDARKAEWLRKHPEASGKDLERVAKKIATELGL